VPFVPFVRFLMSRSDGCWLLAPDLLTCFNKKAQALLAGAQALATHAGWGLPLIYDILAGY